MPLPMGSDEVISLLSLSPHPEGGFYRQTFADEPLRAKSAISSTGPATSASSTSAADSDNASPTALSNRPGSTQIYYLLPYPEFSSLHRIDAVEGWHYYLGTCALEIVGLIPDLLLPPQPSKSTSTSDIQGDTSAQTQAQTPLKITRLGTDLIKGDRPQHVVLKGRWFGARLPEDEAKEGDWVLVGCTVAPGFVFEGGGFEMGRREVLEGVFKQWWCDEGKGGDIKIGDQVRRVIKEMCRG